MVATPALTPVTIPAVPIDARALLLLHAPPLTVSDNVMVAPVHTAVGPDMVPGDNDVPIVMVFVAIEVPHPLATV